MAILGLTIHSWLGWLTGVFLIDQPWGPPTLKSWFSFHNLWSVIVIVVQHVLLFDFVRQRGIINSLGVNKLSRDLHTIMLVAAYTAFWSIRLVYVIYAKKLAVLLNRLYFYPVKNQMVVWKSAWRYARLGINLSVILSFVSSIMFTLAIQQLQIFLGEGLSWFSWAGQIGSGIIATFFGSVATMSSLNIAFALITSITFYLGMIFGEFCDELEALLSTNSMWFTNDFNLIRTKKQGSLIRTPNSREILLKKLEHIQDIFEASGQIISPLVLIVFVTDTFGLVTGVHELLINRLGGFFAAQGFIAISEQLLHIMSLVLVGQHVKDTMNKRKEQLRRLLLLHPETCCNQDAVDIAKWMISFDWNLSACGFFQVDRKLLSGIMATAMTYIVILVQLQISLNSPGHSSGSGDAIIQ